MAAGDTVADTVLLPGQRRARARKEPQVLWGSAVFGDLPVPGRYSTPGKADLAVYRSLTADWLIRRATDSGLTRIKWGEVSQGDFPAPADFTVAGTTDVAVYLPSGPASSSAAPPTGPLDLFFLGNVTTLDAPLNSR